jgi:hypothetical protein
MVNRVREVVLQKAPPEIQADPSRSGIEMTIVKRVIRQKFLSWNAASAGQMEVIEYLEELIELTKLLVGANEFRSGMLTRPTYRGYVDRVDRSHNVSQTERRQQSFAQPSADRNDSEQQELRDQVPEPEIQTRKIGLARRRTTVSKDNSEKKTLKGTINEESETQKPAEDELPRSLQRVRSRRMEEMASQMEKSRSRNVNEGKRGDKLM